MSVKPISHEIRVLQELPSPEEFYEGFVKPRTPVLLKGCATTVLCGSQPSSAIGNIIQLLKESVNGSTEVEVNRLRIHTNQGDKRNSGDEVATTTASFSPLHSIHERVTFAEFLKSLEREHSCYYLTTQSLPLDEEDRPCLHASPVSELVQLRKIQLRPQLIGRLVPMSYNLWIGKNGIVEQCNDKGISSFVSTNSSGLHHDFHDNLYCLLEGKKRFRLAAPGAIRNFRMQGTVHTIHSNGRIVYQEQIDEDGMIRPDGALEQVGKLVQLEERKEKLEELIQSSCLEAEKKRLLSELDRVEDAILDFEMTEISDYGGNCNGHDNGDKEEVMPKRIKLEQEVPLNFVLEEQKQRVQFQIVQLDKGDLLYLPAGWFHEVFSYDGLHVAFNYWMHPPDIDAGGKTTSFLKPYNCDFWLRDWEARNILS